MEQQLEFDTSGESLFIPGLTLRALRDSRYRNPAYALSELVDNSIDARAKHIDVLCLEREELVRSRHRWKLSEVAVLDDGHGMSKETLVQALRFGGRQLDGRRRIGKYGMGLPTASVSQCRRVDVWTWENGIENLQHCYIDVDAIEQHDMSDVPMPDQEAIPAYWLEAAYADTLNKAHGTLVAWSRIDRINQRSDTIFNHIEREIGRIHRHFINDGEVIIRAASFREGAQEIHFETDRQIRPNDPLYLMQQTSTPHPWNDVAMFEEQFRHTFDVDVDDRKESVEIIYSIVKPDALRVPGGLPGNAPHGKHARQNMGVSVVREGREILLENAFLRAGGASTNPENRWWGCEVRFNGGADDLFGVDHNKQMAANFTHAANMVMNIDDSDPVALEDLADVEDKIYEIVVHIRRTTRSMYNAIRLMMERRRETTPNRGPKRVSTQAEEMAKQATQEAIELQKEQKTATDKQREELPAQQRQEALEQAFVAEGRAENDARILAKYLVENDAWYHFESDRLDGFQMFRVRNQGGVLRIILNVDHPVHDFIRMFEEQAKTDLSDPVRKAGLGIILMLMSWGRMEDQIELPAERRSVQEMAMRWGKHVDEFINALTEFKEER